MYLPNHILSCIQTLEQAGYAAYVVGGCVRDALMGLTPHDYDMCTNALPDEIADKIANAYNQGFEFTYFDGSEGTNPPFEYHVSNAQYKVYSRMNKKPLFCEGAAKTHFG